MNGAPFKMLLTSTAAAAAPAPSSSSSHAAPPPTSGDRRPTVATSTAAATTSSTATADAAAIAHCMRRSPSSSCQLRHLAYSVFLARNSNDFWLGGPPLTHGDEVVAWKEAPFERYGRAPEIASAVGRSRGSYDRGKRGARGRRLL